MNSYFNQVSSFFRKYPALSTVRFYLLGIMLGYSHSLWIALVIIGFLVMEFLQLERKSAIKNTLIFFLLSLIGFLHLSFLEHQKTSINQTLHGDGVYKVHQIKKLSFYKRDIYLIQGILKTFNDSITKKTYYQIPLTIKTKDLSGFNFDRIWELKDLHLNVNEYGKCSLKYEASLSIHKGKKIFSLVYLRFSLKQKVLKILQKKIENFKTYKLLAALTVGELDHKTISFEFSRLSLQHLVAISGLHFGILASILSFGLRHVFSRKILSFSLVILMTAYALFIGGSPSVARAYWAILLFLVAPLFGLKSSAINSLGIALWVALLSDPMTITHTGFILSFLATFGILLLYKPWENFLQKFLIQRSYSEVLLLGSCDRILYVIGFYLKKSLALNLSVTFLTLPALLFLAGSFSFLGFFYNLLIPFLFSFTMLLLVLGFLTLPLELLSNLIFTINEYYTSLLLKLISLPPLALNKHLRVSPFSSDIAILSTAILLTIGVVFSHRYTKDSTCSIRTP